MTTPYRVEKHFSGNKKPPEPYGSRGESMIRGTTLVASRGRPLRTLTSPISVTGEPVPHYWKRRFVHGTDSGTRPPGHLHRFTPTTGSLKRHGREDFSFVVFMIYTIDIKAQTPLFVNRFLNGKCIQIYSWKFDFIL